MDMMNDYELIERLYEISGPSLRLRIATELMDAPPCGKQELVQMALTSPEVQKNIEFYAAGARMGSSIINSRMIHGSKPEQLENVAGKLWALGIRKGVAQLDEFFEPYVEIMEKDCSDRGKVRVGYGFYTIAQLLSLLGYTGGEPVAQLLQMRLDQVYSFVKEGRYDIYVDAKGYQKVPSVWKSIGKIIDPDLTITNHISHESPLPNIYDIFMIVGMKQAGMNTENEMKANAVLEYCYDERYQKEVMHNYGIMLSPNGNYYSMGWSVHIPGYRDVLHNDIEMNKLLLLADAFSYFGISREFAIFKDLLDFLENYRKNDGFYCFPGKFIPRENQGYFVNGKNMGLGEDRKQRNAILIESTFRVLKLKKNLGVY
jgi:hypothetical protein